jgi:tRNA(fMet)-specific endonuclease VapC
MNLALDTSRYTDLARGVPEVVQLLERAQTIWMPFVTLAELRASFAVGTRGRANERHLQQFLTRPQVLSLFADDETTRHYASLYQQLRRQGTPIPSNDLWIAALVVQHNLVLYNRDQHFEHLTQLPRA